MGTGQWKNRIVGSDEVAPDSLLANPLNWRVHPKHQQDALKGVIDEVGFVSPVLVQAGTDVVVDGHMRVTLALRDNIATIPVIYLDLDDNEVNTILATFDPISALAIADKEQLDHLLREVTTSDAAVMQMLSEMAEREGAIDFDTTLPEPTPDKVTLADRFLVPPFTVLDARQGYWQERKRSWLALGIKSELGRGKNALGESEGVNQRHDNGAGPYAKGSTIGAIPPNERDILSRSGSYATGNGPARTSGQDLMRGEHVVGGARGAFRSPKGEYAYPTEQLDEANGTSIFDPVLCELAYRWFSPPTGKVLDPFAGGSVRGIVAAKLGRSYTGIDLSDRQVGANYVQGGEIVPENCPEWHIGDSRNLRKTVGEQTFDFIFSCPPYADLEVYSDHPDDLSTMPYEEFLIAYRHIIAASVERLANDRFACFVVGDVRDNKGIYRNFVSHTIQAFEDAGARLYNEAILVTAVGSLPIRVGRQFEAGRKLGKTHQNVLVFVKGDPKRATENVGPVDVADVFDDVEAVA